MEPTLLIACGLGFTAVTLSLLAARAALTQKQDELMGRLARLTASGRASQVAAHTRGSMFSELLRRLSVIARPRESSEELSRTRATLVHAGYRGTYAVEVLYGTKVAFAALLLGGLLAVVATRAKALPHADGVAVLLAAIGFYAPNFWVRARKKERQLALSRALSDALDLLVTCVEAGLGLEASLSRIAEELALSAPVLAAELRLTSLEMNAGISRADTFRRLAERCGLEELRSLSAILIQTELFGTSIAQALRLHSSTLRTRRAHRAEEKAATVAVKMLLPLILFILPSLFAVILGPAVVRIITILLPTLAGDA